MTSPDSSLEVSCGNLSCIRFFQNNDPLQRQIESYFGKSAVQQIFEPHQQNECLITVQFQKVKPPNNAQYVGKTSCSHGEYLYVRDGRLWVSIPIEEIWTSRSPILIIADPEYPLTRLLGYLVEPIMKIRALLWGYTFVHSSSVLMHDTSMLFGAWGNTGKTNLVLHLEEKGGGILSDDWSLLQPDGSLVSYPKPVNLMNYNLDMYPRLRAEISLSKRVLYWIDRLFRRLNSCYLINLPRVYALGSLFELALQKMSNVRIPIDESMHRHTVNRVRVFELHKLKPGSSPTKDTMDVVDFAHAMRICFEYENARFFDRLLEYQFARSKSGVSKHEILSAYQDALARNVVQATDSGVTSIGVPSGATKDDWRSLVREFVVA